MSAENAGARRPALLLVTGAPGSGKSTLARRLAVDLGLPLLMKDEIKETLYDSLGLPDQKQSQAYGGAAYRLLYVTAHRLVAAGVSAVLESNFYRGWSEESLRPFLSVASVAQIHCGGDAETIVRRYRERAERGERHAGHHDFSAITRLQEYLADGRTEPLDLDGPVLRVVTTGSVEYAPGYEDILAFARAVVAGGY